MDNGAFPPLGTSSYRLDPTPRRAPRGYTHLTKEETHRGRGRRPRTKHGTLVCWVSMLLGTRDGQEKG